MGAEPAHELVPPVSHDPVPDLLENVIGASQYISPSYWLGWAAEYVTGTNPWAWVAGEVAGDWEAVQKAGVAIKNLGEFNAAYAGVINSATTTLGYDWQGHAADSAREYFTNLSTVLKAQIPDLAGLGAQFESIAVGMYEMANSIKGLLETLTDYLIAIGIEAAAAAASSWTVIGPILSGAAAAVTIVEAVGTWGKIIEVHTHAWNAVQGFVGLVAGYLGGLQGLATQPLPAGAYDHPGV